MSPVILLIAGLFILYLTITGKLAKIVQGIMS